MIDLAVLTEGAGKVVLGKEALLKRSAQIAKKNVKSLSGPPETVRYTAKSVLVNIRKAAGHLKRILSVIPGREVSPNTAISITLRAEKTTGPAEGRSQVFAPEKDAVNTAYHRRMLTSVPRSF